MKISMIAAISKNRVIGEGLEIPWKVKGEQQLFRALTFNSWLLVGRKTFDSMGLLPNRKFAILSRSKKYEELGDRVEVYSTIDKAIESISKKSKHLIVSGGGEVYMQTINLVDTIHLSIIDAEIEGDVFFPELPDNFELVYTQEFNSNINYTYQIWTKNKNN